MKQRTARLHQSPKEFKLGIENCQKLDQNNEKKSEFLLKIGEKLDFLRCRNITK